VIVFLTVLPPALSEANLKVTATLPAVLGLTLMLTLRVAPASMLPTDALDLTPLPLTLSITPKASASPEFEMFAV